MKKTTLTSHPFIEMWWHVFIIYIIDTITLICFSSLLSIAEVELPPSMNIDLHQESGDFSMIMIDVTSDGYATVLERLLTRFPERVSCICMKLHTTYLDATTSYTMYSCLLCDQ